MTLVVDASVAVKWLTEEPDSAIAASVLSEPLIAPRLFLEECANVLARRTRNREITAQEAAALYESLAQGGVVLHEVDPAEALKLAIELNHPLYDCIYLALARAQTMQVITADERFFRKAVNAGYGAHLRLLADFSL